MAIIEAEQLFTLNVHLVSLEMIGNVRQGSRNIAYLRGAFSGPEIKGTVENGADWFTLRPDGVGDLDIRLTLKTDRGELVYMYYRGLAEVSEAAAASASGGQLPSGAFRVRIAARFETSAPRLARLNRIQAAGVGVLEPGVKCTLEIVHLV
jgi:hypothetical protein